MKTIIPYATLLFLVPFGGWAQSTPAGALTLDAVIDSAMQNNHLLQAKRFQVQEKTVKAEDLNLKKYPSVLVSSTYLYNANVTEYTIPAGALGVIPGSPAPVLLPNNDIRIQPMQNQLFTAGVTVYQPLTQQWKIGTGVKVDRTDAKIATLELQKNQLQLRQAVERLYFGLLINRQKQEESQAKIRLLELRLQDVDQALLAGKSIDVNKSGLLASLADEKQNLLKTQIQEADYRADLLRLTGIENANFELVEPDKLLNVTTSEAEAKDQAAGSNPDVQMAKILEEKAALGVKATKQSFIPDLGIVGGYMYQHGTTVLPANNPFVGINLKWNLQDLLLTRKESEQRKLVLRQAEENKLDMQQQITSEVEKAYRKIKQLEALIEVARESVTYREADLAVQRDRKLAGVTTEVEVLTAEAALSKAQSDLYSALFAYRMALTDLEVLTTTGMTGN